MHWTYYFKNECEGFISVSKHGTCCAFPSKKNWNHCEIKQSKNICITEQRREKWLKHMHDHAQAELKCFYCFRVFGNPDEMWCVSFWNGSSSITSKEWKKMATFIYFSDVVSKFNLSINVTKNCNVMVICLFRKGMSNVITMLWMIIKSRFNF